jgi:hypothetical protein
VIDLFAGGDPFEGQDEEAGLAAFGGLIVTAGPGLCALNVDAYVAGMEQSVQDAARRELERTQRPQGIAGLGITLLSATRASARPSASRRQAVLRESSARHGAVAPVGFRLKQGPVRQRDQFGEVVALGRVGDPR